MTSAEIRQSFMDFFAAKGHEIVPSSPVVLPTDPTLLFTNAGMNPFKEIFLGARKPESTRVADTQKCIRVSGKHNDLEEVGHDTYHHTFFEMLGNWSFGDYSKPEAITWAWELMTGVWGLPKDRLWATVYRSDEEAMELWKTRTDIPPEQILKFDEKDNFWEMGETGPCGPCSEIHIDLTEEGCTPDMVNAGRPDVIELWNLVFIQYNRKSDRSLEDLPETHVDTGMGLERVAAVMQGKASNYDTDLFTPMLDKLAAMSGRKYEGDDAIAMRVCADHVRTLSIAMSDGVMPSNEGRGYVLRRLLRRAVRYGRKLGFEQPFLGTLFPVLEGILSPVFPELTERRDDILRALHAEEESFAQTLDRGMRLFDEVVAGLREKKEQIFPGDQAFQLYDTFGFPLDLTVLMAHEQDFSVDEEEFSRCMEAQRERARRARKDEVLNEEMDLVSSLVAEGVRSEFTGYGNCETESGVQVLLAGAERKTCLTEGDEGIVILAQTPFYAESGGQLGDKGFLRGPQGEFEVWDTRCPAEGLILHIGKVIQGRLSRGEQIGACVDAPRRQRLARHHTATHLMNAALRELVSGSVKQAGSLVAPDRLRFDFTHYEAVSHDALQAIERRVNEWIMQNDEVGTTTMAYRDVPGSGIIAVFDEKYGDEVRVVDIGGFSRELCGGTHVVHTGEIGAFRIVAESSVASGIRRIEAVCGWPAWELTQREHDLLRGLAQRFSIPPEELPERIDALVEQNRRLEKEGREREAQSALGMVDELLARVIEIEGVPVLATVVEGQGMDGLRHLMDELRQKLADGVIVLGAAAGGKVHFMAASGPDSIERGLHAGRLIGAVAKLAGGGGGGQPHKAQAGGKQPEKVGEAIEAVPGLVADMLG